MAITGFSLQDNLQKVWFIKKTFLLVDTNEEMIMGMFLLIFFNADIWFKAKKLI